MWLILMFGGLGCIFSVGNRAKIGVGELGVVKYSFWGQNDIDLAIRSFFFLIQITNQNGIVLECQSLK